MLNENHPCVFNSMIEKIKNETNSNRSKNIVQYLIRADTTIDFIRILTTTVITLDNENRTLIKEKIEYKSKREKTNGSCSRWRTHYKSLS